jgi:hypothetical protein
MKLRIQFRHVIKIESCYCNIIAIADRQLIITRRLH